MKRHVPAENTALAIAIAIGFFGTIALFGWVDGVFAKLDAGELAVVAGFVTGFACLTYVADPQVRGWIDRASAGWIGLLKPKPRSRPAGYRSPSR